MCRRDLIGVVGANESGKNFVFKAIYVMIDDLTCRRKN